jgi:glutamine synthetase
MKNTHQDTLDFVEENDIRFVRLSFCDLFGNHKNMSLYANGLAGAFERGVPFDASLIDCFAGAERSDLTLWPDPDTFQVLPWRPQQGRVARYFCNIKNPDGSPFVADSRNCLSREIQRLARLGLECRIGWECEFMLFQTLEDGSPSRIPNDQGGYFDIAPLDCGENIRREICLSLEELGMVAERSHHNSAPGQNCIFFGSQDILKAADSYLSFKSAVKALARTNGLFASFMPKPFPDVDGNGLHISLSLFKNGINILKTSPFEHSSESESFLAGILEESPGITAFLNPVPNSYARLGASHAPEYVTWSKLNHSQLIRVPSETGQKACMELRGPDPTINPYLALALILHAGMDGIDKKLPLPQPFEGRLDVPVSSLTRLPRNLAEALTLAQNSECVHSVIDPDVLNAYFAYKNAEHEKRSLSEDLWKYDFEHDFSRL